MTQHVMIDLETMGTAGDSAIIQIGAAYFDPMDTSMAPNAKVFFRNVSLQSSLMLGMQAYPETLQWWKDQEPAARAALHTEPIQALPQALGSLKNWLDDDPIVWSHGATFDIALLELAYRLCEAAAPWSYKNVRDTRTVFWLAKELGWVEPQKAVNSALIGHHALHDAQSQIVRIQQAMQHILSHTGGK